VKLNTLPPRDFVALRVSDTMPKTGTAEAYWKVALGVIQWKYSRTSELPAQVPAEFRLADDRSTTFSVEERAIRASYWAKLREEWIRPENWHTSYGFSLDWVLSDLEGLVRGIKGLVNQT